MSTQKIEKFNVIGISVRTTNENGQASIDIPALWNRFMTEGIANQIPNKLNDSIYCMYTDYELDHTKPYTTILGCLVENLETIPDGMIGKTIENGIYSKRVAKGNILEGMVFNEWIAIWNSDINRSYTADFEIYGEKAQNPENAEVEIYLAVN